MMKRVITAALCACLSATAWAQTGENRIRDGLQATYTIVKGYIIKAAEQMPEADYSFKPTPEVRSFGQLVGHIADSNYVICGSAAGEKPPAGDIEKTRTTKADLAKALGGVVRVLRQSIQPDDRCAGQ